MRSSSSDPTERIIVEVPAGTAGTRDIPGKYIYHWDYLPSRSGAVTFRYTA